MPITHAQWRLTLYDISLSVIHLMNSDLQLVMVLTGQRMRTRFTTLSSQVSRASTKAMTCTQTELPLSLQELSVCSLCYKHSSHTTPGQHCSTQLEIPAESSPVPCSGPRWLLFLFQQLPAPNSPHTNHTGT